MTESTQKVHTGDSNDAVWVFDLPPSNLRASKLQLLTIGRVSVYGNWTGHLGEHFVAYAPLLKVPKDIPSEVFNGFRKT